MQKLISRLEKNEPCSILLGISMELNNARYQQYTCSVLGGPETIKAFKSEGIIKFTCKPFTEPFRESKSYKERDSKITVKGSEILFNTDFYDDPEKKVKLELSKKKNMYRLTGFDGRDNVVLIFGFNES